MKLKNNDIENFRKELLSIAKYIQFPNGKSYNTYKKHTYEKLPIIDNSLYITYSQNAHHFKPFYHREYVLPIILKQLGITFNIDDFHIKEQYDNKYDISILVPKNEYKFEAFGYTRNEHLEECSYDDLIAPGPNNTTFTNYHKLYRYGHECSCIINKTINNERVLMISGDSQLIPDIPVIACYFKKLYFFDNRTNKSYLKNIYDDITDVIIATGFNNEEKYIINNLK